MTAKGDNPFLVLITGMPASGKYTIGRYLVDKLPGESCALIHPWLWSKPIVDICGVRGAPLVEGAAESLAQVRDAVLDAARDCAPLNRSFVFTTTLFADNREDRDAFEEIEEIAAMRGMFFLPVRLECSDDELRTRAGRADRVALRKITDGDVLLEAIAGRETLRSGLEDELVIDTTSTPIDVAVDRILAQIDRMEREMTTMLGLD